MEKLEVKREGERRENIKACNCENALATELMVTNGNESSITNDVRNVSNQYSYDSYSNLVL